MSNAVSSAVPEELFRYADTGVSIGHRLIAEARPLGYALEHFTATCREPYINDASINVDASLADELRAYGQNAIAADELVRDVGRNFQAADTGHVGSTVSALVVPDLLPDWEDLGDRLVDYGQWLLAQGSHLAWEALQHIQPVISGVVERVRSFRDSVRESVRDWWRRADAWQQRMWEKLKSFESPLLKYIPEGLQDFFRSAQRTAMNYLEWAFKNDANLIWGFVWGEPLFDEVWGAGAVAFIGDFLGGLIFWSDIRDIYKYGFFKPFILGEGSFPENLPYVIIAAVGLIPWAGDVLKLFKRPLARLLDPLFEKILKEIAERIVKRKLAKLVEAEVAERLVKELGTQEAERLVKQLLEGGLSPRQIQNLVEELGANEVKRLSDMPGVGAQGLKRLLDAGVSPQRIRQIIQDIENSRGRVGEYTNEIQWRIHPTPARPAGPGYWGVRDPQPNPRVDAYERRVNPNNESYYLPRPGGGFAQFENITGTTLQDGKLIMKRPSYYDYDQLPPFARAGILDEARRQVEAASAQGFSVEWLVSDEEVVEKLQQLFREEGIDITVTYLPE